MRDSSISQFQFNQQQSLTIIPNSCLSILFLPAVYSVPKSTHTVVLNLHYDEVETLTLSGSYMEFQFTSTTPDSDNTTKANETFEVKMKVFATNDHLEVMGTLNGFLGIGPCPTALKDYSFAY